MKNFWISLLFFILFMCACKTKKVGSEIDFTTKEDMQTEYVRYQALVDTTSVLKTFMDNSKLNIIETITIIEYDKETGTQIKKTDATRTIAQDTDKVSTEEEQRAVSEVSNDSLNQFRETTQKVESKVETVTKCNGLESFGKWLGIILGIGIIILLVILWNKIKKWLHL